MNLELRALAPGDVPRVRTLAEDPETGLWNPVDGPDHAAWIAQQAEPSETGVTWAVVEQGDLLGLLGIVSLFSIDREQGTGELGYRVHPDARGRGVATAGLTLAARHGFTELGLRRLELFHAVENPASCVVAERAGFRLEGTLRQSYVYGDGTPRDEHLHARLATD